MLSEVSQTNTVVVPPRCGIEQEYECQVQLLEECAAEKHYCDSSAQPALPTPSLAGPGLCVEAP